jgi:hypothetical protein
MCHVHNAPAGTASPALTLTCRFAFVYVEVSGTYGTTERVPEADPTPPGHMLAKHMHPSGGGR